jgi:hypothetical protein
MQNKAQYGCHNLLWSASFSNFKLLFINHHDVAKKEILKHLVQCTEVRFVSLLSGGFTTMAVINPPERKLAKHTSVQCVELKLWWRF